MANLLDKLKEMNSGRIVTCLLMFAFVLVASSVFAAHQPADHDRWLEECMKIRSSSASGDVKKSQYAEAAAKGNIFTPLLLERLAKNRKDGAEAEKWAKMSKAVNRHAKVTQFWSDRRAKLTHLA